MPFQPRRLAFYGRLVRTLDPHDPQQLLSLRVFKPKQREGVADRVEADGCTAICRGMFKKDTDLARFAGKWLCLVGRLGELGGRGLKAGGLYLVGRVGEVGGCRVGGWQLQVM